MQLHQQMSDDTKKEYELEPDSELRFELGDLEVEPKDKKVTLELKSGHAEIFGTELVINEEYEFFSGSSVAVNTWQGCTIELKGTPDVSYVAKETPAVMYLNCHAILEHCRVLAEKQNGKGPIAMVVGPCGVGKSTFSRLLVNYAVRMNRKPIYVNIDVGQTEFSIPGTLGVIIPTKVAGVEEGFSEEAPLIFHYGYSSPQCNELLYKLLITRIAEVSKECWETNRGEKHSGMIINTSGWTSGEGYRTLIHAAQTFEVDAIFVMDEEKLYNDLIKDLPKFVKVVLLPKSSGVVKRSETERAKTRRFLIHRYFYGITKSKFQPFKIELNFDDVNIYKVTTSTSAISSKTTLMPLKPIPQFRNHLLSISLAKLNEDDIVQSNISGFLHVQDVNMQKKIITVLSHQSELKKNSILLLSEVKYHEEDS